DPYIVIEEACPRQTRARRKGSPSRRSGTAAHHPLEPSARPYRLSSAPSRRRPPASSRAENKTRTSTRQADALSKLRPALRLCSPHGAADECDARTEEAPLRQT